MQCLDLLKRIECKRAQLFPRNLETIQQKNYTFKTVVEVTMFIDNEYFEKPDSI